MGTRYKVTKEQVEKLVENFVMEAAAPEATKHIKGSEGGAMVEKRPNSGGAPSKKDWGRNDEKKHAAEAKKHLKGDGSGSKTQVEKRKNTPSAGEVDPGTKEDELTQSKDAKKHVKGSVAESRRIDEGKNSILQAIETKVPQWVKMGSMVEPSSSDIDRVKQEAEANDWLGEISLIGGKKVKIRDPRRKGKFRMVTRGATLAYKPINADTKVGGFGHGNEAGYSS